MLERAREILSYFVRNPRAADSLEGLGQDTMPAGATMPAGRRVEWTEFSGPTQLGRVGPTSLSSGRKPPIGMHRRPDL